MRVAPDRVQSMDFWGILCSLRRCGLSGHHLQFLLFGHLITLKHGKMSVKTGGH